MTVGRKAEADQELRGPYRRPVGIDGVELAVQAADGHAVVRVFGARQIALGVAQLAIAVDHVIDGAALNCRRFLFSPGKSQVGR